MSEPTTNTITEPTTCESVPITFTIPKIEVNHDQDEDKPRQIRGFSLAEMASLVARTYPTQAIVLYIHGPESYVYVYENDNRPGWYESIDVVLLQPGNLRVKVNKVFGGNPYGWEEKQAGEHPYLFSKVDSHTNMSNDLWPIPGSQSPPTTIHITGNEISDTWIIWNVPDHIISNFCMNQHNEKTTFIDWRDLNDTEW
jgi:hypothetical protein